MQNVRTQAQRIIVRLTGYKPVQFVMQIAVRVLIPRHRIGAAVVIFNAQGDVLLLHHTFHGKHPWSLPGGWTNRHEKPDDTVIREVREETGLTIKLGQVIFFTTCPPKTSVNIYFCATDPQGEIKLSFEADKAAWFAPTALPSHMLKKNYEAIQLAVTYLEGRRMKAEG